MTFPNRFCILSRWRWYCVTILALYLFGTSVQSHARPPAKTTPSIKEFTKDMQSFPGYLPFYWDASTGKIWLEIGSWNTELLHVHSLPHGIGSNDIGLDRGQWGKSRIVFFRRVGPKVLLIQPNYGFRAYTNNPAEKHAVTESFAQSVLWGFTVAAEEGNRVLVDATDFFLSDVHSVANTLKKEKQGSYKIDLSRSALHLPACKNFPNNTEVEALLTFTGQPAGEYIKDVVPTPDAVTVRVHHSFIQLPDTQYKPRTFHPQCGFFWVQFKDYAAPLGEPMEKRYILRHRLQKKNPHAATSEAVKPIIYYLDPGTPEPVRSALLEGARWWSDAFEAAGYKNAYQVKMLPEGIDPMDVRYNVIQWVHRATRGWSYGRTIVDPRTGEILRGHVTLGSLRVRQDILIAEGLLAPFTAGKLISPAAQQMALARLKQLSAHEVGHTLGLAHNFFASTKSDASVMDYPHPKIQITKNGKLDVSNAYSVGVGEWDKTAIVYGYSDIPKGADESKELAKILQQAKEKGLQFISDQDARPAGGAHPQAHLWDNGVNAVDELNRLMKVRDVALKQFGEDNIPEGVPFAALEERLVPIYLLHRYQIEAVAKVLGGLQYNYAIRGEDEANTKAVPAEEQQRALSALLHTIDAKVLALPQPLLGKIPPRPQGYGKHRELFKKNTGPAFDALAPAEAAADHTVGFIFHPGRCARLVEQQARDSQLPGLGYVIDHLLGNTWRAPRKDEYLNEIARVVDNVVLYRLMALARNEQAAKQVRAIAHAKLQALKKRLEGHTKSGYDEDDLAHYQFALEQIRRFEENPDRVPLPRPVQLPPGSPIGCGCSSWNHAVLSP